MRRRLLAATALLTLALAAGAGAWWAWPHPKAPPTASSDDGDDTGMTRKSQRELMQEIGYIK